MSKEFCEAELLSSECQVCGYFRDEDNQREYEEVESCEECGSVEFTHDTSFEGLECEECSHVFDPWEGAYIDSEDSDKLYCAECVESGGA